MFVVNLPRSLNRKKFMSEQLDSLGISFEFMEAIDGENLSIEEVKIKHGLERSGSYVYKRSLCKGEIGCALSHFQIYRKIVAENIEVACILEDDASLSADFAEMLDYHLVKSYEWEILLLGHFGDYSGGENKLGVECAGNPINFVKNSKISRPIEMAHGSHAYIIKNSAAGKLLNFAFPVRMPADDFLGSSRSAGVDLYVLKPPCAIQNKSFSSTIYQNIDLFKFRKLFKLRKFLRERVPELIKMKRKIDFLLVFLKVTIRRLGILQDSYAKKL
ncbi:MAG: glycosyltransferase family 25 protein [Candidatus Riflebacteria bacterium]|nr:glycosyltransferase family 25 protein [Candidatus Riflebacteria bacterium]